MTYEEILYDFVQKDDRLIVMTAENRAAIRNLPPKLGKRFMDAGICEQTMIGMAAGLALRGRIPVVHALATFLTLRAFEFIRTDVGIGKLPVILVGGVPGFLSDGNGPTHQAIEDVAIMRGIPGMQVFCPSDAEELAAGMPAILESGRPCYIRYYAGPAPVKHTTPFELGKAELLGKGSDITLVTYGFLLKEVVKAQVILEGKGFSVGLINMRMLADADKAAIISAGKSTKLTVTIEDHFQTGGLYSIVSEAYMEYLYENDWGFSSTNIIRDNPPNKYNYQEDFRLAKVFPIALNQKWFKPALLDRVLDYEGFTGEKLAERIEAEFLKCK
ncbi:MAG: transketolase [Bacteroidetes bacterium]|nr:transketolase [Bacteroidota bacterium]